MPNLRDNARRGATVGRYEPEARASSVGRGRPGRSGSSFAARFGRTILQHGIATIPSALLHYQGELQLSAQQVWLISYILSHKWDEDLPYPSLKKMAKRVPLSLSQLQRIKNSLCEMGYLKVYARYDEKRGQSTNAYDFAGLFHRIEVLLEGDEPPPNPIRAEGSGTDVVELAEVDPSFVARYGRVIARHGVAAVPRAIFTHQSELVLSAQQVWFIAYIFSFQWDTALPYPSIRRMATQTGYSSVQLHNIKNELVKLGYLRLVKRISEEGGQDTNAYDFSGLLERIRALLEPETAGAGRQAVGIRDEIADMQTGAESSQPEEMPQRSITLPRRRGRRTRTVPSVQGSAPLSEGSSNKLTRGGSTQPTVRDSESLPERGRAQFVGAGSNSFIQGGSTGLPGGGVSHLAGGESKELPEGGRDALSKSTKRVRAQGTSSPYARGIARAEHEEEAVKEEANQRNDSNHLSLTNERIAPPYSPYIAAIITDFSHELNDTTHVISNVTQGLRIWQQSGLDEPSFTEVLYEAKRLTRSYQGKQGLGTINNKMAYFFKVLRQIVASLHEP